MNNVNRRKFLGTVALRTSAAIMPGSSLLADNSKKKESSSLEFPETARNITI